MAQEKNDISEIVKKCKILLLDIEGTTTSISFVKDKLFPYAEENVKDFLNNEWDTEDVKDVVIALRKLALDDEEKQVEGVVAIPGEDASKDDQIEGLVKSVKWQMSVDRKVGPLKQLQGLIWKKGYDKGDIKGHVYDDVSPALELWRSVEGQKVYIYSSGSVQAQKLLFGLSSAGDLLKFIDGHFDTAVGAKQEAASYTAIAEKIGCKPEEILFLTDIDKEAEAARAAGVQAAIVSREGNAPLAEAVAATYPVLYSFAELAATNKRKPDVQDEQPAKVLKTDAETNVKTESETEAKEVPEAPVAAKSVEKSEEPEKMEVEEEVSDEAPVEKNKTVQGVETMVEEVTDPAEVAEVPICDIEPIIEESTEKTENKETEKMETDVAQTVNTDAEAKQNAELKNGDKDAPVPEETPPAVITEIKDVTNDKESLSEEVEMIEDLVPVVEEPPAQDMEELQNVGEVLEKECDEILSKVQDVTNLDNIPLKPLLNPIAEETMETENTDSNDIVDRILDRELELEMKQCADIDLNTVQQISEVKQVTEEDKSEKQEAVSTETKTEKIEEVKVTKEKAEESSPTEKVKENSTTEQKVEEGSSKDVGAENDKAENKEKSKSDEENATKEQKAENIMETDINTPETVNTKAEVEENKIAEIKEPEENMVSAESSTTENNVVPIEKSSEASSVETENKETPVEKPVKESAIATEQSETPADTKESDKLASDTPTTEEAKTESEVKEIQVNGKTTNGSGDADMVDLNGDASKEDELSSRLSMENGKEVVNGANGDSNDAEKPKSENNGDELKEVVDIKVKTVAVDEPRNDPIEQPTEA